MTFLNLNDPNVLGRISQVAVPLLRRELVLGATVLPVPGEEFSGDNGDTVTLRVPQPRASRAQNNPGDTLNFVDIEEAPTPVAVRHIYDATRVTQQQLTLEIVDFARQVIQPMSAAVATGAEDELAAAMNDVPADIDDVADDNVDARILEARRILGRSDVPMGDRFLAVSPEFAEVLLGKPNLTPFDAVPTPTALSEARIGRYRGFIVVESNGLAEGQARAYHRSGFGWTTRAPVQSQGMVSSSTTTDGGVAIRLIYQWDSNTAREQLVLSTFAGAAEVDADRVVGLELATNGGD